MVSLASGCCYLPAMNTARHIVSAILTLAGSQALLGCECVGVQCGACPSVPVVIRVIDAVSGQPMEDAIVTIEGASCPLSSFSGPGAYGCQVGAGTYAVNVAAPDRASQTISVTLSPDEDNSCCGCGPQTNAKVELAATP